MSDFRLFIIFITLASRFIFSEKFHVFPLISYQCSETFLPSGGKEQRNMKKKYYLLNYIMFHVCKEYCFII